MVDLSREQYILAPPNDGDLSFPPAKAGVNEKTSVSTIPSEAGVGKHTVPGITEEIIC